MLFLSRRKKKGGGGEGFEGMMQSKQSLIAFQMEVNANKSYSFYEVINTEHANVIKK